MSSNTSNPSASQGSGGLATSDIIGIAIGVPSAVLASISAIIAFMAWKYPTTAVGELGNSIGKRFTIRGGDAHGAKAYGRKVRGGDAYAGPATGAGVAGLDVVGGTAYGGKVVGTGAGGDAYGGSASA
jgi:hypothetical protein